MNISWRVFLHQVRMLTIANLKSRYRKTVAGFIWVVMSPLIMYGAQSYAFSKVLKLPVQNYSLFLLSGLLPWIFISQTLEMSASLIVNSGALLKAFPIHPVVFLLAQLADNMTNFLFAFTILLIPAWISNPSHTFGLMLLPIPVFLLAVGVFGMAWLLAVTQVFFRDMKFILTFLMGISFFLTPIFYSAQFVPEKFRWLVIYNPFHHLIAPFRNSIYHYDPKEFLVSCITALLISLNSLALATWIWRRKRNAVYLNI